MNSIGNVSLVGAGCGAADLITLRGMERICRCDVLVYDDLIDETLLRSAPNAEKIFMGKRSGRPSASQEEINQLLIQKAREGKRVVRLKGGDPFVFGRGGEEILALRDAGISCEEIPGISSAIAIPAAAGIPVTHRGLSRSVHIITAHGADGSNISLEDCRALTHLGGTLVFLMGLAQLPRITDSLLSAGMPADTPAAVISGGNAPRCMTVRGDLDNIAKRTRESGLLPPAVIVVGAVAGLELLPPCRTISDGITVGLTGTDALCEKLQTGFHDRGFQTVRMERSEIRPFTPSFDFNRLVRGGWVVFTSSTGVHLFFERLSHSGKDARALHACRFAVIGRATGDALQQHSILPDLCPEVFTGEALANTLLSRVESDSQVFIFRSAQGDPKLRERLADVCPTEDIPLYDVVPDESVFRQGRERLASLNYLVFASAGGVELFFREYGNLPAAIRCICIGEKTAEVLRTYCDNPLLLAPEISCEGILRAVENDCRREKP